MSKQVASLRKLAITAVQPDDLVYIELRCAFGLDSYDTLSIPDKYDVIYVVVVQYIKVVHSTQSIGVGRSDARLG